MNEKDICAGRMMGKSQRCSAKLENFGSASCFCKYNNRGPAAVIHAHGQYQPQLVVKDLVLMQPIDEIGKKHLVR